MAGHTRPDGRHDGQCRPTVLRTGVVTAAAGSAYGEFGGLKVIVAVHGPKQGPRGFREDGSLKCEVKKVDFAPPEPGAPAGGDVDEGLSAALLRALAPSVQLHLFPKAEVEVHVLILDSDGAVLGPAAMCCSLALADAAVPLFDLVTACTVSRQPGGVVVDPCQPEVEAEDASLLVTCLPSTQKITQVVTTGEWDLSAHREAMGIAVDGCAQFLPTMQAVLLEAYRSAAAK